MNHVILTGRLVRDPEIRYTDSKKAVASFTLAVYDGKDRDGEKRSQFIPCVAWEKTAELIDQHFTQGDPLTVIGKITVRTYEKDGAKRYVTEVKVSGIEFPFTKKSASRDPEQPGTDFSDMDDDADLPF